MTGLSAIAAAMLVAVDVSPEGHGAYGEFSLAEVPAQREFLRSLRVQYELILSMKQQQHVAKIGAAWIFLLRFTPWRNQKRGARTVGGGREVFLRLTYDSESQA